MELPCSNLTLLVSDRYAKEVMRVQTDSNGAFRLPASLDRATVVVDSTAATLEVDRVEVPNEAEASQGLVLHLVDTGDR